MDKEIIYRKYTQILVGRRFFIHCITISWVDILQGKCCLSDFYDNASDHHDCVYVYVYAAYDLH